MCIGKGNSEKKEVIHLRLKSRFRFLVQRHEYKKEIRNGEKRIQEALIILQDIETGVLIVHPFSEFLISSFNGSEIKTRIDYGLKVTPFLNYILDNSRRIKISNFNELEYYHVSEFLNFHCGALRRETYKGYLRILARFYYFLSKKGVLKYCKPEDFTIEKKKIKNGKFVEIVEAPFPNLEFPENTANARNEHDMPPELQALLLEIAYEEVNIIVFGLALQMFGGFRLSEASKTKYSMIRTVGRYGEHGLLVTLNDNEEGTRPDLKNNGGKGNVKRPRLQQTLSPFGLMGVLLEQQKKRYKANDGSDAVFVNANGKAMSYGSYQYYFTKLKKIFLQRLRDSDNPMLKSYSIVLESRRWNSHIGRGIFTNNLVDLVDNPVEIQILRGDLSPNSMQVYIGDSRRLGKRYEENTENSYINLVEKIKGSISKGGTLK